MTAFVKDSGVLVALLSIAFMNPALGRGDPMPDRQPTQAADDSGAGNSPASRPATLLPEVSYEDLALLVQIARRSFADKLMNKEEKGPSYRPPSLRGDRAILHVTLRRVGAALAEAETREMDVVDAAVAAGVLLGREVLGKDGLRDRPEVRTGGDTLGIEFEWIGPAEPLDAKLDDEALWSDELLHAFEGGVEGIGVTFGDKVGRVRPGTVIARNYTPDLALLAAEEQVGLTALDKQRRPDAFRYFRFRTYHLWQPTADLRRPVLLVRGETTIEPAQVTANGLDEAIGRMADYLRYRQNRNGWFSYQFAPSRDRYLDDDSATAQLHALQALSTFAAWSNRSAFSADARRGILAASAKLMEVRRKAELAKASGGDPTSRSVEPADGPARIVLHFEGYGRHLEVSARLMLALLALVDDGNGGGGEDDGLDDERAGLLLTLLSSQEEGGRLHLNLEASPKEAVDEDAVAGWALLAVSESARWHPNPRIERVLNRALSYYGKRVMLSKKPGETRSASPVACSALVRAFASGYLQVNAASMSDFVFGLADQFVNLQLTPDNCPWPELLGAINVRRRGAVGADTAWYLTALADALALAQRVGDEDRVRSYRGAVRAAARFVMQLEVRKAGCFYIRSPRDALGGVRTAPWDNQIRIDHCAEALLALMRAREVLFGKPKPLPEPGKSPSE